MTQAKARWVAQQLHKRGASHINLVPPLSGRKGWTVFARSADQTLLVFQQLQEVKDYIHRDAPH